MDFWIYILKCADNSYYTGHTDNLEQRIAQHQQRYFPDCYTATCLPISLVFSQPFPTRVEALTAERKIKGWSRKKKEAMMRGDWQEVSRLAKSKNLGSESIQNTTLVRPELRACRTVEGQSITEIPNTVHPELVEGHSLVNSPSTSLGRTDSETTASTKKNQA